MALSTPPEIFNEPAPTDGREVEWHLACEDLDSVRRWLAERPTIGGLVLEAFPPLDIFDTYLDTADWRIYRAGFALRIRSASGRSEVTLKSLSSKSTDVADRREMTEALANTESDSIRESTGPVGTRLLALCGTRTLQPLFEIRTVRQRFAIRREGEARPLGELALDETAISRPHEAPRRSIRCVEVEALTKVREPLKALVKTLQSECGLQATSDTKFSHGLETAGLVPAPAPTFLPTPISASTTLTEVALANLRRHFSAWRLHEPGARLGEDPEELHDMRVAGRRLEAILRQFQSSLPAPFLRIRPTLKTVLRALGQARDLDVALSELQTFSRLVRKSERGDLAPLKDHLLTERSRTRVRMLSVLDSIWVQKSLEELQSLLTAPAEQSPQPRDRALRAAPRLIRRRYRKLRNSAGFLESNSSTEACHKVRGQVKKLRYTLEAVAVIYGKPAAEMLRALRRWQEKLGIQQDAAVASERLKAIAGAPPASLPPGTMFLMGRLAEHYASIAAQSNRQHAKAYQKVRRRWKKLRSEFEHLAESDAPERADPGA